MSSRELRDRNSTAGLGLLSIATCILASLALVLISHPTASQAGTTWEELWADNFDHSLNEGWTLATFGRGDQIGVVPESTRYPDRVTASCEPNNVMYGSSTSPEPDHGFVASTPALDELGINMDLDTYSMSFRYMVVGSCFCWTMPLASPDANLVISECTQSGKARLGVLEHNFQGFRPIGEITIDEWHSFRIVVKPLLATRTREVSIFLDDVLIDRHERAEKGPLRGMTFIDLPAYPVDLGAGGEPNLTARGCFGEGYWDDVCLSILQEDPPTGKGPRFTITPNPFNPSTSICMELDASTRLDVTIFDVRGRRVRELHAGVHPAGPVRLTWNGLDDHGRMVSSGVYLVRTMSPEGTGVARAVLLR